MTESVGNRLSLVDIATGAIQVIASNLLSPEGVAYSPDGIALVAEVGSKSLRAIEIGSGKSIVLADNLPIGLLGYPGGPPPYGFTGVALSGNTAYISGDLDNSIRTVTLNPQAFSIPEPSTVVGLLCFGGLGTVSALRRRRRG